MKMHFAYHAPVQDAVEAPAPKARVRGRNEKTEAMLRKLNGSARYGAKELLEQTSKALAQRKAKP